MEGEAPAAPGAEGAAQQGGVDDFDAMVGQDFDAAPEAEGAQQELDAATAEAEAGSEEAEAVADAEAQELPEDADPDAEDAPAEQIHGLEPDAILDAIREGRVPDELMEVLTITQTLNGEDVPVTLKEARENGMRLSDYSRAQNELRGKTEQHDAAVNDFMSMVDSWKVNTPEGRYQTRMMLEQWIGDDVLLELARDVADEQVKLEEMGDAGREAFLRARKAERELAQERSKSQRLETSDKTRNDTQNREAFQKKLNGMRDTAFKKLDIHLNEHTSGIFYAHLRGLYKGGDVTQELAEQAAQATIEDLGIISDRIAKERGASAESQRKAAAGQQRLDARPSPRGGTGKPAGGRLKRGGLEDFEKMFG